MLTEPQGRFSEAGFLGSNLTDLILAQGYEVVGIDNFITGKRENLAHLTGNSKFTLIEHDVIQPLKVDGRKFDITAVSAGAPPL